MTTAKLPLILACLFGIALPRLCAQLEFQHIFGTELDNSYHKVLAHNGDYYLLGSEEVSEGSLPHATFSRIDTDGNLLWTIRLDIPSQWNAAVVTDNGDFLLVGSTLPQGASANSLVGLATPAGVLSWIHTHNLGAGEVLTDIVRSSAPQDPAFPYYITGSRLQTLSVGDVMLLQIDENGAIGHANLIGTPNVDEAFTKLIALPGGESLLYGHYENFAVTYKINNQGVRTGGKAYASNMRILHASPASNGGFLLGGLRNMTSLAQVSKLDNNLNPIWSRSIPQLNRITQIWAGGPGLIYALGSGTVGGVNRSVLLELSDGVAGPVLNWARYLDEGETAYTAAHFIWLSPNRLAYVDGRTGNPAGAGQSDAFFSTSGIDLETCITQELTITLNPVSLSGGEYFNTTTDLTIAPAQDINWQSAQAATGIVCQSLLLLSPLGEIVWEPGQPLDFSWTAQMNFSGNYRLKILELASGDAVPDELPDTGLFFEQTDINGTTFPYPVSAPAFQPGIRYAWQVETVEASGQRKSQVGIINITLQGSCTISVSGIPEGGICPGDCFNLEIQFPENIFLENRLLLYTDYANPQAIRINGTGTPYSLGELNDEVLESPPHFSGAGGSAGVEICILEGAEDPAQFFLYYYRPGSGCSANPLSDACCHDVVPFSVEVAAIPDFTNLQLTIRNPAATAAVQEICSGDALHFAIETLPVPASIQWQSDEGNGWQNINGSPFIATNDHFFVLPGHAALSIDCNTSTTGYVDKIFRAKITVNEAGSQCEYYTTEYPLRICCPLTSANLEITTDDPVDLTLGICEGDLDMVNLQVNLTSDHPFVNTLGEFVNIAWSLNGPLPQFANQTNFMLTVPVGAEDLILTAQLTNCAGKTLTLEACIHVDPKPACPVVTTSKDTLCPGEDAVLTAVGNDNCLIHWEYSVNGSDWFPTGSVSNTLQYTNPLIGGGASVIHYRVRCIPLLAAGSCDPDPAASACATCVSDPVTITEIAPPAIPTIENCVPETVCADSELLFAISSVEAGVTYTWYVNGLPVGEGHELLYTMEGAICYWVEASNECTTVSSGQCCLPVCEVTASISCPLPPNDCAFLGVPITLTAGDSQSSCEAGELFYLWTWTDSTGSHEETSESINPMPEPQGTTYTLTVTNELGCTDTASLTIVPCN